MIHKIAPFVVLLVALNNSVAQVVDVPAWVKYQVAIKEKKQKIRRLIERELSLPTYVLFEKMLLCGPNILDRYKKYPETSKIEKGDIIFEVPQADGSIAKKHGKAIQSHSDFQVWWKQVINDFKGNTYTIRKLNYEELQFYWNIIFFDIEEPIFIIENKSCKIIMDLDKDLRIRFIEEYR